MHIQSHRSRLFMRRRHPAVSTTGSIDAGNQIDVSSTAVHKGSLEYPSESASHAMALDKLQPHAKLRDDSTSTQSQAATGYESTTIVPAVSQAGDRQAPQEQGQSVIAQMLAVNSSEHVDDQQMGLMPLVDQVLSCLHPGMDWLHALFGRVPLVCVQPPLSYMDLFVPSHPKTDEVTTGSPENEHVVVTDQSSILRQRNR